MHKFSLGMYMHALVSSCTDISTLLVCMCLSLATRRTHGRNIAPTWFKSHKHLSNTLTHLHKHTHTHTHTHTQVPCCHSLVASRSSMTITSHPRGPQALSHIERMAARTSLDVAIDAARVATLRTKGYQVAITHIPREITPRNRLIFASAPEEDGDVLLEVKFCAFVLHVYMCICVSERMLLLRMIMCCLS
jgi:hypothetical protein